MSLAVSSFMRLRQAAMAGASILLRSVSIAALVARRRHGRVDVDASFFQFLDVVEFDVAAIGQMLTRTFAVVFARAAFIGAILPMSEPLLSTATPATAPLRVSEANCTL